MWKILWVQEERRLALTTTFNKNINESHISSAVGEKDVFR